MSYQKITNTMLLLVLTLSWSANANADIVIQFSIDDGATFGDSFNIDRGSSVNVGVFLTESSPDTALANDGLLGFGLTGNLASSNFGAISAASPDSAFDFQATNEFSATSIDWESLVLNNSVPTGSRIALGSFQFDSIADGISTFTFGDIQPGAGSTNANWLSGAGVELDEAVFGTGAADTFQLTLSTTAIPEPGSASMFAMGAMLLVLRRRRANSTLKSPSSPAGQ
ncbi:MAG: PEP-CTERM sorting domain-containing protein [Planctomycetota bacterium]